MQRIVCRYLFLTILFLFKKRIAKQMWNSPESYHRTMDLICDLWDVEDAIKWMARLNNLMASYYVYGKSAHGTSSGVSK